MSSKVENENKMSDYDEEDIQDFDSSFEEYFECENMDAAFLHDNGMVWDKNEKYIGRFTDDGFEKASETATATATASTRSTTESSDTAVTPVTAVVTAVSGEHNKK